MTYLVVTYGGESPTLYKEDDGEERIIWAEGGEDPGWGLSEDQKERIDAGEAELLHGFVVSDFGEGSGPTEPDGRFKNIIETMSKPRWDAELEYSDGHHLEKRFNRRTQALMWVRVMEDSDEDIVYWVVTPNENE